MPQASPLPLMPLGLQPGRIPNPMKTDHPIYLFLSAGPEAFRVLTGGLQLQGEYQFRSLTIKGLERRLDGIFEPEGHAGPAYVIEFQGQTAPASWYNLLTKIGLYGEQHPERDVIGIGIFLRQGHIPAYPARIGGQESIALGISLDRFLPDWLEREPDNPYVAVFAPLLLEQDEELRRRAPALWRTVQEAPLAPSTRELLSQVLEFWFFERFRGLTAKEIWNMLNSITPIQETRAYQSIFEEGELQGEIKGRDQGRDQRRDQRRDQGGEIKGKASTLKRQIKRRFGRIHGWAERRIDAASSEQLDQWLDGIFDAPDIAADRTRGAIRVTEAR
jgi:predicted transposase YdaD